MTRLRIAGIRTVKYFFNISQPSEEELYDMAIDHIPFEEYESSRKTKNHQRQKLAKRTKPMKAGVGCHSFRFSHIRRNSMMVWLRVCDHWMSGESLKEKILLEMRQFLLVFMFLSPSGISSRNPCSTSKICWTHSIAFDGLWSDGKWWNVWCEK